MNGLRSDVLAVLAAFARGTGGFRVAGGRLGFDWGRLVEVEAASFSLALPSVGLEDPARLLVEAAKGAVEPEAEEVMTVLLAGTATRSVSFRASTTVRRISGLPCGGFVAVV